MTSPTRKVAGVAPGDIAFLLVCCGGQLGLFTVGLFVGWNPAALVGSLMLWTVAMLGARHEVVGVDD